MPINRLLVALILSFIGFVALPGRAHAGPAGGTAQGSVGTSGASGSSKGKLGNYPWPELVVGGNAVSGLFPLQFGIVQYLPKARFGVQYDRQIRRAHWIYGGVALLFDRGDYDNFRTDCGLDPSNDGEVDSCGKGGVVGVDLYAGYAHKFFLRDYPFIVPIARAAIGYSYFSLPTVGRGDAYRLQERTQSWTINVRPGGGVRLFFLPDVGIGFDINLPIGVVVHREVPEGGGVERSAKFLLGIEVLPLIVEYRF